jgi:hypothetical protein
MAAVVLLAAGVVAQARPSFAGEWKKDVPMGQGEPGVDLIITQDATAARTRGVCEMKMRAQVFPRVVHLVEALNAQRLGLRATALLRLSAHGGPR